MRLDQETFFALVPDCEQRLDRLAERYASDWGGAPDVLVSGPGRTELIGNHTDHNNGNVMAAAVQLDALVAAGPSPDHDLHLRSTGWDSAFTAPSRSSGANDATGHDTQLLMAGVAKGVRDFGLPAPPYAATMDSRVAPGSGLSSSAAFEVALAGAHMALADDAAADQVNPALLARAGQYAENAFMGKPSGLMDQMASACGAAVAIDFADEASAKVETIDLDFRSAGFALCVIDSGGDHSDLTADYAAIPGEMASVSSLLGVRRLRESSRDALLAALPEVRKQCGDRAVARALHFFGEQERVVACTAAARENDIPTVIALMNESGLSSATLLQNIVPQGADVNQPVLIAVELARQFLKSRDVPGMARVHGGGFAGTIQAVVPLDVFAGFRESMERFFGHGSVTELHVRPRGVVWTRL